MNTTVKTKKKLYSKWSSWKAILVLYPVLLLGADVCMWTQLNPTFVRPLFSHPSCVCRFLRVTINSLCHSTTLPYFFMRAGLNWAKRWSCSLPPNPWGQEGPVVTWRFVSNVGQWAAYKNAPFLEATLLVRHWPLLFLLPLYLQMRRCGEVSWATR